MIQNFKERSRSKMEKESEMSPSVSNKTNNLHVTSASNKTKNFHKRGTILNPININNDKIRRSTMFSEMGGQAI